MAGTIRIWTAPDSAVSKDMFGDRAEAVLEHVDVEKLNANLKELSAQIDRMLDGVETKGGFRLNGLEVGVEISSEGGINLIGTLTVSGKASITLSFERT